MHRQGWQGWDAYAPFYDWENARTLGRADVPFWRRVTSQARGPVLELGSGTGRVTLPLARSGVRIVGIDRSAPMLERTLRRVRAMRRQRRGRARVPRLTRGDIRALPFGSHIFSMTLAPYGILQSLLSDRALGSTLDEVARVLRPGGLFGMDLVPDVPRWGEYQDKVQMRGRAAGGVHLTLIESVRQDRRRRLTIFTQRYVARRGGTVTEQAFDLRFRTLPIRHMIRRLERRGFTIEALIGDYRGRPFDQRAEAWIILARTSTAGRKGGTGRKGGKVTQ